MPILRANTLALAATLGVGALLLGLGACGEREREQAADGGSGAEGAPAAEFVGRTVCASCHADEHEQWTGSHHDLAMQEADETTVLGDFDGASLTHFGRTSSFFRRDGGFFIETEGADGERAEFRVAYTFGVEPLQQYLVAFPGGRYQVSSLCWDARAADEGGQRWFHLYQDEAIAHDDVLHWTGPNQNWNYMCAECHSTDLRKGYDPERDAYETTWEELDVSCEACHGPGSGHLDWAAGVASGRAADEGGARGFALDLVADAAAVWTADPATGLPRRSPPLAGSAQVDACARCHARRSPITPEYEHGLEFLDTHRPALLDELLYHPDGQIQDEVYVYGSFLQSRMHGAGVVCTDCHDPHRPAIEVPDAVCGKCHVPARYDTTEHHLHEPGTPGASCVSCHMSARTYMVVDPRRDHSFRVPRPDLAAKLGTPDACSGCHAERGAAWAAEVLAEHFGPAAERREHFAEALAAGRAGTAGAARQLARLAGNEDQPGIARATALSLLARRPSPVTAAAAHAALDDADPLVRSAALSALEVADLPGRLAAGLPLLADPVRAVRIEAARILADAPREVLPAAERERLEAALAEARAAELVSGDRPDAHLNLGLLAAAGGDLAAAEGAYRRALELDEAFAPAYANLADLFRVRGADAEGERLLRVGVARLPSSGALHHALGLALVRLGRREEAVEPLRRAAELRPDLPRYAFAHGIALQAVGRLEPAWAVLEGAQERHPTDRELLGALVAICRELGRPDDARAWARRLLEAAPGDPAVRALVEELASEER
ncbi:MAG: multiheme c-type cytochrome [Planctomycetota bacterium]|jgi:tetratricopeptide (TPR) repeat protein|nr:multiheme c-type cytochrome [Planctomycetota bacterium]MDP6761629.1 multiheme c-type cytochrome [Planctomycetota bacterium]